MCTHYRWNYIISWKTKNNNNRSDRHLLILLINLNAKANKQACLINVLWLKILCRDQRGLKVDLTMFPIIFSTLKQNIPTYSYSCAVFSVSQNTKLAQNEEKLNLPLTLHFLLLHFQKCTSFWHLSQDWEGHKIPIII